MNKQNLIKLNDVDNVYVSLTNSKKYKLGYKYASEDINKGQAIIKFGRIIGYANSKIKSDALVHVNNLLEPKNQDNSKKIPKINNHNTNTLNIDEKIHLYPNIENSWATKKCILVISNVSCVNDIIREITFKYSGYKNFDETNIIPIIHNYGCGHVKGSKDIETIQNLIAGYIDNPNCFKYIKISLGCEDLLHFKAKENKKKLLGKFTVQNTSSKIDLISKVIQLIDTEKKKLDKLKRKKVSLSNLTVALQCGGSDGLSSITANPLLGKVSEILSQYKSKIIFSETPETIGLRAELLTRCKNKKLHSKLSKIFSEWEANENEKHNPAPGNIAGGISNIFEKSLGSVMKSGNLVINDVLNYGELVNKKNYGLFFADSPGYDPCSITGQISNGANLILFTTGRGSSYSNSFVPVIKVSSNTFIKNKVSDIIDFDAQFNIQKFGIESSAQKLIQLIINKFKKQKIQKKEFINSDFVPWIKESSN